MRRGRRNRFGSIRGLKAEPLPCISARMLSVPYTPRQTERSGEAAGRLTPLVPFVAAVKVDRYAVSFPP